LSPICQTCGSYYVRPPCPACVDLNESYKDKKAIIPSSVRSTGDSQHSNVFDKLPDKSESSGESKNQDVIFLKMQLKEKDKEIKLLQQSLLRIKEEVERQTSNRLSDQRLRGI